MTSFLLISCAAGDACNESNDVPHTDCVLVDKCVESLSPTLNSFHEASGVESDLIPPLNHDTDRTEPAGIYNMSAAAAPKYAKDAT